MTLRDSGNNAATENITIAINSSSPPSITTATLPLALLQNSYSADLAATGGTPPYSWAFSSAPPDVGISLLATGRLTGTPTGLNDCYEGPGQFLPPTYPQPKGFQVRVTDAAGQSSTKSFCLAVYHPAPVLTAAAPNPAIANGSTQQVAISGANFGSDSQLRINNTLIPITIVSASQVTFTLTPQVNGIYTIGSVSFAEASYQIRAFGPYVLPSNTLTWLLILQAPTVNGVQAVLNNTSQPCRTNQACQLVITGSGLYPATTYQLPASGVTLFRTLNPATPAPWSSVTTTSFTPLRAGVHQVVLTNPSVSGQGGGVVTGTFTVSP